MNNGKLCVSVCAETADEIIERIRDAEEFADVVEVRFDCLRPSDLESFLSGIFSDPPNMIYQAAAKPLVSTFRAKEQGGRRDLSLNERNDFWNSGLEGDYCDVEQEFVDDTWAWLWENRICSYHDLSGVPDDITDIFDRLANTYANIIKIAASADDICDAIPVWRLLDHADLYKETTRPKVIPIAMGEAGKWTRILGLAHGAYMTYASLEAGRETADGQITARDMTEIYRVRELDRDTKVFGVIGDPASQSLSPYMHNPAFAAAGINAVFIPLQVRDVDQFMRRMVLARTREVELNFSGFSVTMPHKQRVMEYLDAIDPTAKEIGAVNTIKIDGDKLTGYNTDAQGFIDPLKEKFGDLAGASVAVFGAGGAARACVFALKQEKADITVFARDAQKAEAFAEQLGVRWSTISNFRSQISDGRSGNADSQISSARPGDFDIVVHATPLGMKGPRENESLFTADELKGVKFIYDLVTRPVDTPILLEAQIAGVPAIGGLDMLIAQGVKQFEIWTGLRAPVEKMKEAVRAQILRT